MVMDLTEAEDIKKRWQKKKKKKPQKNYTEKNFRTQIISMV